jgi:hypothetical protein
VVFDEEGVQGEEAGQRCFALECEGLGHRAGVTGGC